MKEAVKFPIGGMDIQRWEMRFDSWAAEDYHGRKVCSHCVPIGEDHAEFKDYYDDVPQFVCRAVVTAFNEGGHCSAGVCLDCILEAAKNLEG